MNSRFARPLAMLLGLLFGPAAVAQTVEKPIDFSRDIRPILSDKCFECHGPEKKTRKVDLRLDTKKGAFATDYVIVPGDLEESELYFRITSEKADERMPPPDFAKKLTADEIDRIGRWIDGGAQWREHWSFEKPVRAELPEVDDPSWSVNPIDRFVYVRMKAEGLSPSPPADKQTLIRRVTFDLTGLPPTLQEIDAFLADESPDAYEKVVDRLLASPRYGEQMARYWLDAVRYGDTHGLHLDNFRSIWPYRDWAIRAMNENKPFDEFTVEQIAGDLLPEPTVDQRVGSGFVRMHITTSEGGSIDDEFVFRYAVDRVETTSTVWMGLTTGCAVCHDHKFDPITQKEFYQLYAFFNNTREAVMDGNKPYQSGVDLQIPTAEQTEQMTQYAAETAAIEQEIKDALAKVSYEDPEADLPEGELARQELVWIDDALPAGAVGEGDPPGPWNFVGASEGPVHGGQKSSTRTATGRSQHYFTGANPALEVGPGDVLFCHVYLDPDNPPREIMFQWNDGTWEHRAFWGENVIDWGTDGTAGRLPMGPLPEAGKWVRLEVEAAKVNLPAGARINGWAFTQFDGTVHWDTAGIVTQTPQQSVDSLAVWEKLQRAGDVNKLKLPEPVKAALRAEPDKQTPEQRKVVRDYFLENIFPGTREMFDPLHGRIAEVKKKNAELEKQIPWTLIASERPGNQTRQAFVRQRGDYDKPTGDPLQRAVPAALPPLAEGAPKNRLGLAQWLVDPKHPLTARVTVNRFWQQYFGTGIVKTAEDFGSQGEWPSHPELLDWLAVEFVESGWDTKAMQRRIVTSATYRQSSKIKPIHLEKDRDNRLLARGPRFRMDAEMVRDNALAVSGLLVEKLGGPSVKPYQPSGLWKAVGYSSSNTANFKADQGDALYRRGLYTFWKRTSPPPTMLLLDAPSRETCTVRRERTNTPLAALALLNDVQFFECARNLAQRMMLQGGDTPEQRIAFAFRLATARPPEADELDVLRRQYDEHLTYYQNDKEAAEKLLGFGESPRDESLDAAELAAWAIVANVILNLDETLTKQ